MSHDEIRRILTLADQPECGCGAVNAVVDQHIAHVDARIRELEQLRASLAALRERCQREQAVEACGILQGLACGILQGLAEMESEPRPERHTHLG